MAACRSTTNGSCRRGCVCGSARSIPDRSYLPPLCMARTSGSMPVISRKQPADRDVRDVVAGFLQGRRDVPQALAFRPHPPHVGDRLLLLRDRDQQSFVYASCGSNVDSRSRGTSAPCGRCRSAPSFCRSRSGYGDQPAIRRPQRDAHAPAGQKAESLFAVLVRRQIATADVDDKERLIDPTADDGVELFCALSSAPPHYLRQSGQH